MDGNIIRTVTLSFPGGVIAFDGVYIWVTDRTNPRPWNIHQLDYDGNILKTIQLTNFSAEELTFDGKYFWGAEEDTVNLRTDVFQFDTDGNLILNFTHPFTIPAGMAADGVHIWLVGDEEAQVAQLDRNGNEIYKFDLPGAYPGPITFTGEFLWMHDPLNSRFRQIDWNGNAIADISFTTSITDICYNGKDIFAVVFGPGPDYLYQIS